MMNKGESADTGLRYLNNAINNTNLNKSMNRYGSQIFEIIDQPRKIMNTFKKNKLKMIMMINIKKNKSIWKEIKYITHIVQKI